MFQPELRKIIFILFDEHLLSQVVEMFEKYEYIIENNPDGIEIKTAYLISKIYTTEDKSKVLDYLKQLGELEATDVFPDIKMLQCKLAMNCYENNLIEYSKLIATFNKNDLDYAQANNPVVYNTPALYRVSINGKDFDDNINNINKCLTYLGDKIVFRQTIDKVDRESYKNYLKIRHSLELGDYEYGFEAVRNLQELFYQEGLGTKLNTTNYKELLSDYIIILDFMSAFQLLGYNFTDKPEYSKLKQMFKDIIIELSVDSLLILETSQENILKTIAETKKRLINDVKYDVSEIDAYIGPILQRIKDNGKRFNG